MMAGATDRPQSTISAEVDELRASTILLVEDNEDGITTVVDYLEFKGLQVVVARSGQQALDICRTAPPALILMDIQMPGMSGLEAIRAMRQLPGVTHKPIIAVTALVMPGDREHCLEAGADDYISKPLNLRNLVETVQHYLRCQAIAQ